MNVMAVSAETTEHSCPVDVGCDSRNTPYTGRLLPEKQISWSFGARHQRVLFLRPLTPLKPAEWQEALKSLQAFLLKQSRVKDGHLAGKIRFNKDLNFNVCTLSFPGCKRHTHTHPVHRLWGCSSSIMVGEAASKSSLKGGQLNTYQTSYYNSAAAQTINHTLSGVKAHIMQSNLQTIQIILSTL